MNLNLDIYLSGYVQKLYKIKQAGIQKESEITLRSEWWSVWRCEHLASDEEDKHVFVFTNAASCFTILVFQMGLSLDEMLLQFNKELLHRLREFGANIPKKNQAHTRIIKGNPRSLISVMNNIIYHAEMKLFEKKKGYDQTEAELNEIPWAVLDFQCPVEVVERLLCESPITNDKKIVPFLKPYNN
jgi:hypothetical protein